MSLDGHLRALSGGVLQPHSFVHQPAADRNSLDSILLSQWGRGGGMGGGGRGGGIHIANYIFFLDTPKKLLIKHWRKRKTQILLLIVPLCSSQFLVCIIPASNLLYHDEAYFHLARYQICRKYSNAVYNSAVTCTTLQCTTLHWTVQYYTELHYTAKQCVQYTSVPVCANLSMGMIRAQYLNLLVGFEWG